MSQTKENKQQSLKSIKLQTLYPQWYIEIKINVSVIDCLIDWSARLSRRGVKDHALIHQHIRSALQPYQALLLVELPFD